MPGVSFIHIVGEVHEYSEGLVMTIMVCLPKNSLQFLNNSSLNTFILFHNCSRIHNTGCV